MRPSSNWSHGVGSLLEKTPSKSQLLLYWLNLTYSRFTEERNTLHMVHLTWIGLVRSQSRAERYGSNGEVGSSVRPLSQVSIVLAGNLM